MTIQHVAYATTVVCMRNDIGSPYKYKPATYLIKEIDLHPIHKKQYF